MNVFYKKIPNGIDDIAKYMGLKPRDTIFMHSLIFDDDDKERITISKGKMLYAEILSFMSNNDNGAYSVICHYNDDLLNFLVKEQIINKKNLIRVGIKNNVTYPYNSPSKMLYLTLKEDKNLRNKLNNKVIVSSFISKYDVETAKLINGRTILPLEDNFKYTSKYWFRKMAEKYAFDIPYGFAFKGLDNLYKYFEVMLKRNPNKIWIKLESQTSGVGNVCIDNGDYKLAYSKILAKAEIIYDKEYILKDMPLIIECDVNNNDEDEIINIGVEAIITENDITILGGVAQKTDNGRYLGSYYNIDVERNLNLATETAKKVFIAYSKEGYRGFINIDVLITKNRKDGSMKGYNIDPNARFSAGLMLLKTIHHSESITGSKIYGISYTYSIPSMPNLGEKLLLASENNLYNNNKGTGIIPALLNDITPLESGYYYLKSIVVAKTFEEAEKMFKEFKNNIKRMEGLE